MTEIEKQQSIERKIQKRKLVLKHTDEILKIYVANGLTQDKRWRNKIAKQLHIDASIVEDVVFGEYKRLRKAAGINIWDFPGRRRSAAERAAELRYNKMCRERFGSAA